METSRPDSAASARHQPIRIVPIRSDDSPGAPAPAAAPSPGPNLTYRGGPLLTAVQVFTIFWGSDWNQQPRAALAQQIDQFFDYVVTSPLVDQMAEYNVPGMSIVHGAHIGTTTVTTPPPGGSVADADIQQMIQREISADPVVPPPTPSSLYYVFLPPGVSVSLGGGSSCTTFCGYHSDIGQIFYAVMPYPDCSGCGGSLTVLDALTSTSSHELCEAITDPVPGRGWYDDNNGEIGDICAWQTKQLGAYAVQLEWSNQAGRCV
jgi:hypothetical protein